MAMRKIGIDYESRIRAGLRAGVRVRVRVKIPVNRDLKSSICN